MLGQATTAPSHPCVKEEEQEEEDNKDGIFAKSPGDDDATYRPHAQLPEPLVVKRNLAYLIKNLDEGIIDVDPEYQREVVWTADRMTGLINSLMENYYIPPIILNRKPRPDNDNTEKSLVCVDGKQRLSSVQAFVKGIIPCHDHRGEKWWFTDNNGVRKKHVLPEQTQKEFLGKEYVSFEFVDLSPDQEEELFARVQMGMSLTVAEKIRASTGPWQELARLYVADFPAIFSLMKERARAKDFQLALSCFSQILEVQHPTAANGTPTLKTNYIALPKFIRNKGAVDDGTKSHLANVFQTFNDLLEEDPDTFTNEGKWLRNVKTFAPVEMVAVCVIISMYSESRNNKLLIGDIRALRTELREQFLDLRLNTMTWKFTWEWIDQLEAIRGAVDDSTVERSSRAPKRAPESGAPAVTQQTPTGATPTARKESPPARTESVKVPKKQKKKPAPGQTSPDDQLKAPQAKRPRIEAPRSISASVPWRLSQTPPNRPNTPSLHGKISAPDVHIGVPGSSISLTPAQARRNRIAELHSYRAPTASMMGPPSDRTAPMSSITPRPLMQYAPTTGKPPLPAQPDAPHPPLKRPKKSRPQPRAQLDKAVETIDLTSDTEQERQDLLSSFGRRTNPVEKPISGVTGASAGLSKQNSLAITEDLLASVDEAIPMGTSPY